MNWKSSKPYRTNNPMALIQVNPDKWQGLAPGSTGFLEFRTMAFGLRAGMKNLYNAYYKRGIRTPLAIFKKYAPTGHGANDPDKYAEVVAGALGIKKTDVIPDNLWLRLVYAIIMVETGGYQPEDKTMKEALDLLDPTTKAFYMKGVNTITPGAPQKAGFPLGALIIGGLLLYNLLMSK
jgi:hypothetical protein